MSCKEESHMAEFLMDYNERNDPNPLIILFKSQIDHKEY